MSWYREENGHCYIVGSGDAEFSFVGRRLSCINYLGTCTTRGHYTHQPALTGSPVKNWRILSEQSFLPACLCWCQLVNSNYRDDCRVPTGVTNSVSVLCVSVLG